MRECDWPCVATLRSQEATALTVLTDGDAGLRAIQHQVAPHADYILDWFHISMRFTNLEQLVKGINGIADGGARAHALLRSTARSGVFGMAILGEESWP